MSVSHKNTTFLGGILVFLLVVCIGFDVGNGRTNVAMSIFDMGIKAENARVVRFGMWLSDGVSAQLDTRLQQQIVADDQKKIRVLLDLGANPNISIVKGFPALYWCVAKQRVEVGRLLIEYGADMNQKSKEGWSSLSFAIFKKHNDFAKLLINSGANIKGNNKDITKSPLWVAVRKGNIEMVNFLLKAGVDSNTVKSSQDENRKPVSIVGYALLKDQYAIAIRLINEKGPSRISDINVKSEPFVSNYCLAGVQRALTNRAYWDYDQKRINPITEAIKNGASEQSIKKIIDVNLGEIDNADESGDTPLMAAIEYGQVDAVEHLLARGCDINKGDGHGYTPVLLAADSHSPKILEMLVKSGADLRQSGCPGGRSLFNILIQRKAKDLIHVVIAAGADLNIIDSTGTALQSALSYNDRDDIAAILLEGGADPFIGQNSYFGAPVDTIKEREEGSILKTLLPQNTRNAANSMSLIQGQSKELSKNVHVVAISTGKNRHIPLRVRTLANPVTLFLSSRSQVSWVLQKDAGVVIEKIVLYGKSSIENYDGITLTVKENGEIDVANLTNLSTPLEELQNVPRKIPFSYIKSKDDFVDLLSLLNERGIRVATVQSEYAASNFIIDDDTTMDFDAQVLQTPPKGGGRMEGESVTAKNGGFSCYYGESGAYSSAISQAVYNTGKWYFEVEFNPRKKGGTPGAHTKVGLMSPYGEYLDLSYPKDDMSTYYLPNTTKRDILNGDVVGFAVDLDLHKIYPRINGRWLYGEPQNGTGVPLNKDRDYVVVTEVGRDSNREIDEVLILFDSSKFSYPLPEGYRAYAGK